MKKEFKPKTKGIVSRDGTSGVYTEEKDISQKYVSQEQLNEVMRMIRVGDDIVFDNEFGVFKIIKLANEK